LDSISSSEFENTEIAQSVFSSGIAHCLNALGVV